MSAIKEAYIMFNDRKVEYDILDEHFIEYVKVRVGPNE